MSNLSWQVVRNLENSLQTFLSDEVTTQSLTIIGTQGEELSVDVRVGWKCDPDWNLPVISAYVDDRVLPRLEIGSNRRLKSYTMIIDIRSVDEGSRMDLATWVEDTINEGFDYYDFQPNAGDPMNPIQTKEGFVAVDFVSSTPVRLGDNADLLDKYRHNITVSLTITGVC